LNNGDPVGANYKIQAIDAGLTVDFAAHAPAAGNSNTIGKLTLTLNHAALVWLGFTLKENAAAEANSAASGGLRLLMDVVDQNGMNVPWLDYHIRAEDTSSPVDPGNQGGHLAVAHFHDTPDNFGSNPLVLIGNGDNVTQLNFGLGAQVNPGATFTATDILLHERDYEGLQREFRVETIPSVPEPATFLLAALGVLGLAAFAHRRRRAA
jgi:MYXO-CTERM domain-containing protein